MTRWKMKSHSKHHRLMPPAAPPLSGEVAASSKQELLGVWQLANKIVALLADEKVTRIVGIVALAEVISRSISDLPDDKRDEIVAIVNNLMGERKNET